eukprot:4756859-Pleurochrysis_carterae.AAC.1
MCKRTRERSRRIRRKRQSESQGSELPAAARHSARIASAGCRQSAKVAGMGNKKQEMGNKKWATFECVNAKKLELKELRSSTMLTLLHGLICQGPSPSLAPLALAPLPRPKLQNLLTCPHVCSLFISSHASCTLELCA